MSKFVTPRNPLRTAILKRVSGNKCSITYDGIKVFKNIGIVGDPTFLRPGQRVTLLCVDNTPVVFSLSGWGSLPMELVDGQIPIGGSGSEITLHPPLTLNSLSIQALFSLVVQKLDLKQQAPHTVLAGGTGAVSSMPAFRLIELDELDDINAGSPDDGDILVYNSSSGNWEPEEPASISVTRQSILTVAGALTVAPNPLRIYNRLGVAQSITEIYACVGTAPTGSSVTATVAGTSVSISAGNNTGTTTPGSPINWAIGAYISMAVTAIGSTVAGSDLVVHLVHH